MGHGGWQGHRQYPEAKPFCFDPGSMVITTWCITASLEVMLFGLFQLFKGGDFAPVDYPSLSK